MASRGLYLIATRAPGTVITALIYNEDHQAHVNGRNALFFLSNGQSVQQFSNAVDPFPGGGESLPGNWTGEVERIRFCIRQIKQLLTGSPVVPPEWFVGTPTGGFPAIGARIQRLVTDTIANNTLTPIDFSSIDTVTQFNTGVWSSSVNPTRFTAPFQGLYLVGCTLRWFPETLGSRRLEVMVNGSDTGQMALTNTNNGHISQQYQAIQATVKLAATDYVEFAVFQNSGGNMFLSDTHGTIGYMVYLGATA
jgi:hypothetical protein